MKSHNPAWTRKALVLLAAATLLVWTGGASSALAQSGGKAERSERNRTAPPAQKPRVKQPAGPLVTLALDKTEVEVGDRLSVTVYISRAENVGHVPFHLGFDPERVRFERGEEGAFLAGDGNPTSFIAASPKTAGSVVVGLSRLGPVPGVSGGGRLCVLEFTAIGQGEAEFGFSNASVRDSANRVVPAAFRAAKVIVR